MTDRPMRLSDIYEARRRIAPFVRRTPLLASASLSEQAGVAAYLKPECLQETGSFKLRGAANRLLCLTPEENRRGVIAVSSGNHGRAVSHVARELGVRAVICLSRNVPEVKVQAIRGLGAEVVVWGGSYDEAEAHALELQQDQGLTWISPFDDPSVIAGQGTIGLELLEDLPQIGTVVVPVSGGGLISGMALALKAANPAIRVIGASMDRAPVMYHSLQAGRPVQMPEEETVAEALAGGIGLDNRYTFRLVQQLVDDVVLVTEDEIEQAMAWALATHHLVVEGGGAVGMAALLQGQAKVGAGPVVVVISGGNVDLPLLLAIARKQGWERGGGQCASRS